MNCQEMSRLLPRLAEREGAPRVALEAARHLAACVPCAGDLLRLRELNGLLDRLPHTDVPATFPKRVLKALRSRGGASLALFLLLALTVTGGGLATGTSIGSIASAMRDPLEAAGTIFGAMAAAIFDLIGLLRTALGESKGAPLELRSLGSAADLSPATVLYLALAAAFFLAGSWAAFGFGARRLLREKNCTDPLAR